jgi:organic radical activating enzyme
MLFPRFKNKSRHKLSLYTTSVCNLDCPECIMQHIMKYNFKYQMTLEEIENLIYYSEKSRYGFDFVLTGGDPLLWKNMEECLLRLKKTPITKSIIMFTNGMFYKNLNDTIVSCLDSIRVSNYEGNEEHMKEIKRLYPEKVRIVERTEFWVNPSAPVPNSSPMECLNPEHMFYNNKIYACPHALSIVKHNGSQVQISKDLEIDFLHDIQIIKKGQDREVCSMCISNNKVRKQVAKIHNDTI